MLLISACASSTPAQTTRQTSRDETFDLNIIERRIVERNYKNSTAVEADFDLGAGLSIRVGVAVAAESINVMLRNVTGRVRFRATLEPLLERIAARTQKAK